MIEKKKCENNHKIIIDWEDGTVSDTRCDNVATKYTIDNFGIFYLCDECYTDDCRRRIKSETMTLKSKGVYYNE